LISHIGEDKLNEIEDGVLSGILRVLRMPAPGQHAQSSEHPEDDKFRVPLKVLPRTALAATAWDDWHFRVYFQDTEGAVCESQHNRGVWSGGKHAEKLFDTKLHTPLAAISYYSGNEVSGKVRYMNTDFF
jgi:hypothetical protein